MHSNLFFIQEAKRLHYKKKKKKINQGGTKWKKNINPLKVSKFHFHPSHLSPPGSVYLFDNGYNFVDARSRSPTSQTPFQCIFFFPTEESRGWGLMDATDKRNRPRMREGLG